MKPEYPYLTNTKYTPAKFDPLFVEGITASRRREAAPIFRMAGIVEPLEWEGNIVFGEGADVPQDLFEGVPFDVVAIRDSVNTAIQRPSLGLRLKITYKGVRLVGVAKGAVLKISVDDVEVERT